MSYVDEVIAEVVRKNPGEPEFHQAVKEVLESIRVVIEKNEEGFRRDALLERIVNPEREIKFRVPWVDDNGQEPFKMGGLFATVWNDLQKTPSVAKTRGASIALA